MSQFSTHGACVAPTVLYRGLSVLHIRNLEGYFLSCERILVFVTFLQSPQVPQTDSRIHLSEGSGDEAVDEAVSAPGHTLMFQDRKSCRESGAWCVALVISFHSAPFCFSHLCPSVLNITKEL